MPQGLTLPLQFKLFITDLDDGKGEGQEICNDAKPEGVASRVGATTGDLDRVSNWAERSLMKFSKGKYMHLPLGRNDPRHQCTAITGWKAPLQRRTMGY